MDKVYKVGLYLRISVEDTINTSKRGKVNPFQNESVSIENQRALLAEYVNLQGWKISQVYCDDGYSGGSFDNRPAFQRMVRDAEAGLIDLIIVKDLSRLGRDYIEIGRFTEEVFPSLGVRFIALMDKIDSDGDIDLLPFRSILNDYHLKDLSRKVKSVMKAKAEKGEYIGTWAPYGFIKNPASKNHLLIDEIAAEIVRQIFKMRIQGYGYAKIAAVLNNQKTLSPRTYHYKRLGIERPNKAWIAAVIKDILANEAYIGHSVRFKTGYLSYKNRLVVNKPTDEWIRCENVFPPIISIETWEAVRIMDAGNQKQTGKTVQRSLFTGLLRCADCGGSLIHKKSSYTSRITNEKYTSHAYICSKNSRSGGSVCSRHTIPENALLTIIREDVKNRLDSIDVDEECVIQEIKKRFNRTSLDDAKNRCNWLSLRLDELASVGKKLYEKRIKGSMNIDEFKSSYAKIELERTAFKSEYEQLSSFLSDEEHRLFEINNIIPRLSEFLLLETLTNDALAALVDHIIVNENEGRSRYRKHSVHIVYRFELT